MIKSNLHPGPLFGTSLVIGGTGMLAGATGWIAGRSNATIVVARRACRFARSGSNYLPVELDWTDEEFVPHLESSLQMHPSVDLALLWVHPIERLLSAILQLVEPAQTILVHGSQSGRPAIPHGIEGVSFVQLGSKATANGRRWLTHSEISAGAITAILERRSLVVGDLEALR